MFSRRIRTALFIDFENIGSGNIADNLGNLLAWFSDGAFEKAPRPRRLAIKRVYWNSSAEKYADAFQKHGVEVILCEKFTKLKNGADIRMAVDVVEYAFRNPSIEEVILLTTDSDFVPLVQWLDRRDIKTAVVVNEDQPVTYTAFSYHADTLIPRRLLRDALQYQPVRRRGFFWRRKAATAGAAQSPSPASVSSAQTKPAPISQPNELQKAVAQVVRVASTKPKLNTSQKDIEKALARVPGYAKTGEGAYFGFGSYKDLMHQIAKFEPKIKVGNAPNNGVSVRYVPSD